MIWCECPRCGHKLFLYDRMSSGKLNIKCTSCKSFVDVKLTGGNVGTCITEKRKKRFGSAG